MRRTAPAISAWCLFLMALSCGGGSAPGGSGTAGTSGGAGNGGNGGIGGSACASAVASQPCSAEGTTCGAENCTDTCQFCNLLRCTNGKWMANEAAPAPCFFCGASLQCHAFTEFCEIAPGGDAGTTYSCPAMPVSCQAAPGCVCLVREGLLSEGECFDQATGQLVVTLPQPP